MDRDTTAVLLQIEDQQAAMSGIFRIARARYARGVMGEPLTDAEDLQIMDQVRIVVGHTPSVDAKGNALYVLAKTCQAYYLSSWGVMSYQLVFEDAMLNACELLSKIPGDESHLALLDIKQHCPYDPASPLNDYISAQAKLSSKNRSK